LKLQPHRFDKGRSIRFASSRNVTPEIAMTLQKKLIFLAAESWQLNLMTHATGRTNVRRRREAITTTPARSGINSRTSH
jgi:hypothetical protein